MRQNRERPCCTLPILLVAPEHQAIDSLGLPSLPVGDGSLYLVVIGEVHPFRDPGKQADIVN